MGTSQIPVIIRQAAISVSAAFLFSVVLWCLNQFLSLRGVVNVVASRIVLGFMWLAGAALILLGAKTLPFLKRRKGIAVLGSLFWILGVVAFDWWASRPGLTSNAEVLTPNPDYLPSIMLLYGNKQIQVYNKGRTNLYLWGASYGKVNVPIEREPRMVAPAAYYYFVADNLEDQLRSNLKDGLEGYTSFRAFATTEDSKKYTIRGIIVAKVLSGNVNIRTQTLPLIDGWKNTDNDMSPEPMTNALTEGEIRRVADELAKKLPNQTLPTPIPIPPRERQLSEWQKVKLISNLSQYRGQKIIIFASKGSDTWAYANDFRNALKSAGWKVKGPLAAPANIPVVDVQVSVSCIVGTPVTAYQALRGTLPFLNIRTRDFLVLDCDVPKEMAVLWIGGIGLNSPGVYPPFGLQGSNLPPKLWEF